MAPTAISPPIPSTENPSVHKKAAISHPSELLDKSSTNTESDSDIILPLRQALTSENTPLAIRFRALFSLKHHASLHPPSPQTLPAIYAIASAFSSPSALLKHELAYCLGQSGNNAAVPFLQDVLRDAAEDPMCRHEAAEALGALGDEGSLDLLRDTWRDTEEIAVVKETCELAIGRIEWLHSQEGKEETERLKRSDFVSVDPAPPAVMYQHRTGDAGPSIGNLQERLMDSRLGLFDRYRAMFALRDLASPPDLPSAVPAVQALATGFEDTSALFRHEIAFVFGQLCHPASIPSLKRTLAKTGEESMVRHEAAEALGSLGDEAGVEDFLKGFLHDEEQVVRESVVVALDMAEYEKSGQGEYAVLPSEGMGLSPMVAGR